MAMAKWLISNNLYLFIYLLLIGCGLQFAFVPHADAQRIIASTNSENTE